MNAGRPPVAAHIRFNEKVSIDSNGCWLWKGGLNQEGYGNFWDGTQTTIIAHRFSYKFYKGPILDGAQIDHLCRVRRCVNPDHLEAVTPKENVRRSPNPRRGLKICKRGHDLTDKTNVRIDTHRRDGVIYKMRTCRQCDLTRAMKYYWKKKGVST